MVKQKRKGRLVTAREPNGRIQRHPERSPGEIKRLMDAALTDMRKQEWGTALGQMLLAGKIAPEMFAAGERWAEYVGRYRQALMAPSPDPRAIAFDYVGRSDTDPDSWEGQREARRHERAVASFVDARAALRVSGTRGEAVVRAVCERGERPATYEDHLALVSGLTLLAAFWGLTNAARSPSDRHRRTV